MRSVATCRPAPAQLRQSGRNRRPEPAPRPSETARHHLPEAIAADVLIAVGLDLTIFAWGCFEDEAGYAV